MRGKNSEEVAQRGEGFGITGIRVEKNDAKSKMVLV